MERRVRADFDTIVELKGDAILEWAYQQVGP
jgi:hypothetical protein